ncbi:hypothetical protein GCK32_015722 [Trichostrongylus colubriformis]|uniref:Uncharacterized protein n=1 Tax=Trichostrongylus colubriformis TaxID=6319 RepID=A0AAN8FT69_TRICO
MDNQLPIRTILLKFHSQIQKATIEKNIKRKQGGQRTMSVWFTVFGAIINEEETLQDMLIKGHVYEEYTHVKEKWKELPYVNAAHRWGTSEQRAHATDSTIEKKRSK